MPHLLRSILPLLPILGLVLVGPALAEEGEEDEVETPGPGSQESNSVVPLPPPRLRPPPGLGLVPGTPGEQALRHWERAEAIVDLFVHINREMGRRENVLGSSSKPKARLEACPGAYALQRGMVAALREVRAELSTAQALAESLPQDSAEATTLQERLKRSFTNIQWRESYAEGRPGRFRQWGCPEAPAEPTPLPPATPGFYDRAPAQAILVEVRDAGRVLWLDDVPQAVSDEWGLGVVVLSPGSHVLCEADPRETSCRPGV
ncbi:MAG: hypothetical protein VX498_01130, partial [Myxococcota bacterium]|nr:hypothetical protein [Myxococcota bacterium]